MLTIFLFHGISLWFKVLFKGYDNIMYSFFFLIFGGCYSTQEAQKCDHFWFTHIQGFQ